MLFRVGILSACLIAAVSAAREEFRFKTTQEFGHDPDTDSVIKLRMVDADFEEIKGLGICHEITGFINGSSFTNPQCGKKNEMSVRVYCARFIVIDAKICKETGLLTHHYKMTEKRGGDMCRTIHMRQVKAHGNIWEGQSFYGRQGTETADFQSADLTPIIYRFVSEVVPNSELNGQQLARPLYVSEKSFGKDMKGKLVRLTGTGFGGYQDAKIGQVEYINPTTKLYWSEPRLRMFWMSEDGLHENHAFCKGSLQGRVRCLKQVGPDFSEFGGDRHKHYVDALSSDPRSSEIEIVEMKDSPMYISREFNAPSGMGC